MNTLTNCGTCGTQCSLSNAISSCTSGTCILDECNGGFENCDGNPFNGCEPLNTLNDCNACGIVCDLFNAVSSCATGTCVITSCNGDFGNCDGNPSNGCETPLNTLANCGGCGIVCNPPQATSTCTTGTCTLSSCNGGFGNCDGNPSNGCETLMNTNSNCGTCGTQCSLSNAVSSCASGTCQLSSCNGGFGNCDGNPSNGCETPLNTNSNCGVCGTACFLSNAISSCTSGICSILSCNGGFENCDGSGCETPLNTLTDCGTCGTQCSLSNAVSSCASGTCSISSCNGGFGNCDGNPSNGCETLLNTLNDCGSCGVSCEISHTVTSCTTGTCNILTCDDGWSDCDSLDYTGCEAPLNSNNNCGACFSICSLPNAKTSCSTGSCQFASCDGGFGNCNVITIDGCESPLNTLSNCGICGTACSLNNAVSSCASGTCQLSLCNGGFGNCDSNPANGCETPLNTLSNCEGCGTTCSLAHGSSECSSGTCLLVSCNGGFGNCDINPANGCETPLNSLTNCGVCGTTCGYPNAITDCSSGACVFQSCASPFLDCNANLGLDGCEVNGNSDNNHCGNCATVCVGAEQCVSGSCIIPTCTGGTADCDANGSCETDINNDVNNCGGCGHVCSSNHGTASCSGGVCSIVCNAAFDNCNVDISDGCETDLHTLLNCGTCASICSLPNAMTDCSTGTCIFSSCNGGFGNCDANPNTGCETPFNTNSNCGGCGDQCTLPDTCNSGICSICLVGTADCDHNGICETDITSDVSNCGSCGNVCPSQGGVAECNQKVCFIYCNPSYADCNSNASDGCETFLLTANNCGGCGNVCSLPHATSTCIDPNIYNYYYYYTNYECAILDCDQGYFDCNLNDADGCESFAKCITSCPEGTIDCDSNGSCETNIYTDVNNCGFCNNICSSNHATPLCTKGECTPVCNQPFADCTSNRNLLSGLVVDNFMEGFQQNVVTIPGTFSNSTFYTSPQGATSQNIIGGERDLQFTATLALPDSVYFTGVNAGLWDISLPFSGGSGICKLQYDSIDNSMNLYQNGLGNIKGFPGGFDITQNGKGIGFRFTYTTDFTVMLSMKVYSPTGKPSVVDIQLTPTSGYDEIRAPFANFVGECDFTSVGAIELIATLEFGSYDISITALTIYQDPNSSMNDGC